MTIRQASRSDLADLLELMREFYAEAGYPLRPERARDAFLPLLDPGELGQVWLADLAGQVGGHLVLTFCYSMEYGGRSAFVDDLFVRPALRNRGLGRALVQRARAVCEGLEVRAMLGVLGLDPLAEPWVSRTGATEELTEVADGLVKALLDQRQAARERKDYAASDEIRDRLKALGVVVEDTPQGPRWTIAPPHSTEGN